MKHTHEPRVDELHVDRRIRRILALEIIFVVILYIIVFTASTVFLRQQNSVNQQIQSRYQMMVDVQSIERLILLNTNLVQSYRTDPSTENFEALVKNHAQFTELFNTSQDQLDKRLRQDYLKIISSTNALAEVSTDKSPEVLTAEINTISSDAVVAANEWIGLATKDIDRLQTAHGLSQRYYGVILAMQGILVIGGLLLLSRKFVLPAFEKILKQVLVQNEKLIKSDGMKTEFLSIASHQLRTPLSVVKWSLAILLKPEQNLNGDQQALLVQAKTSAETVIKLVGNLLNLSRIEQGRLAYHPALTDVAPIIKSIVNDAQIMAKMHTVTVIAQLPSQKVELIVDPLLFKEVIQNLVDNAIAYNRPNGSITITAREMDKKWLFDVADTGMGIMPEDVKSLFTKFYRGMNARSVRPDGSGLGLYFIKKIADLHGGTIKVESEPNQGTVFTVVLPKQPPIQHVHAEGDSLPASDMSVSAEQV